MLFNSVIIFLQSDKSQVQPRTVLPAITACTKSSENEHVEHWRRSITRGSPDSYTYRGETAIVAPNRAFREFDFDSRT